MTVHVVGAGIAGMVAGLVLARAGHAVVLHDAAAAPGGRCAALPDGGDTHALLGANGATLRFLDAIGARDRWVEPEPAGWPLVDLADGSVRRVALAPRAWRDAARRPPGLTAGGVLALAAMATGITDRPMADALAKHPTLLRGFAGPLACATLHTPVAEASSARLGQVLRGLGAGRLLVARDGLAAGLVAPAVTALRQAGVAIRPGARLRALTTAEERAIALHLAGQTLPLEPGDAVILALPPWEAARLVTGLRVPDRHAQILTLHFDHAGTGPLRFIGVIGGVVQQVLLRPGGISATADAGTDPARAWAEIRAAARILALPGAWPDAAPPSRAALEPRAMLRHDVSMPPMAPRLPLCNLALAGDWTWPGLPASIEAAALSGEAAAKAIAARLKRA